MAALSRGCKPRIRKTGENTAVLPCPKKKLQKLPFFHSNRSKSSLEHRLKIVPISILFQTSTDGLKRTRKVAIKFELSASMVPLFSRFVVNYRWPWLSSHAASQPNPLGRDRQEKNQPIENQIRRGTQGTLSLLSQRRGGKKHGFCVEGILNVRRVYEVCILNSCLLTFFKPFYRSYDKSYETIQVLTIWLPVGCCESGTPMVWETVVN